MADKKWSRAPKLSLYSGEGFGQGRTYKDPTDNDSLWPSVTTILKHEDKSGLVQWAADQVAAMAVERTDLVMGDPEKAYNRLRFAHSDVRDIRAEVGTGLHATVEAEFKGTWDFPDLDEEQTAMLGRWNEFCDAYSVKILMSEFTVRGEGYMGTADFLLEVTDPITGEVKRVLGDLKTSKSIWNGHRSQLAALSRGLYVLREVDAGHPGAFRRKGKTKAEDSWWVREDMPHFDEIAVVQIRADRFDYEVVDDADIWYRIFRAYIDIHEAHADLKERGK